MPLSEDEQRILNQIEQQFYESDPAFAQQVSQTTLYRHTFGRVKWGILGFVVGLAFLIATLQVSVLLSLPRLPVHADVSLRDRAQRAGDGQGGHGAGHSQLALPPARWGGVTSA